MAILRDLTNSHPPHKAAVHIAQISSEAKVPARLKDCLAFSGGRKRRTTLAKAYFYILEENHPT